MSGYNARGFINVLSLALSAAFYDDRYGHAKRIAPLCQEKKSPELQKELIRKAQEKRERKANKRKMELLKMENKGCSEYYNR